MKKYIFALLSCFTITLSNAQDASDALLYSSEGLYGTARFKALSGAFGALGGDLSAMDINPAGSAVFNNSFGTLTLGLRNNNNDVNYFNTGTSNSFSTFDLSQGGVVLVFLNSDQDSNWRKFSLGFNFNQQNNLTDEFIARGTSNSSIDDYFLGYANGTPLNLLQTLPNESIRDLYTYLGESYGYGAQQAMLGYQAYVINAVDENDPQNTSYTSAIGEGTFNQRYNYISTGLNGKFSFNVATQYQDKFYLGLNLNSHFINYERSSYYSESNNNAGSETNDVDFRNNLSTLGSGFSFQLGGIAKLTESVRVGATYQSPTWFTIAEETTQSIGTYSQEFDETVIIQPNVVNVFPEYRLTSPAKYSGSFAYIFGNTALISFDYSYKNYSATRFKPKNDPGFAQQNSFMENNLQGASTYRIGGEYRINQLSLRGGYRFEESPYRNTEIMGDLNGYSLGLGYNFGKINLDFSYDAASQERQQRLFNVGMTNAANLQSDLSSYTLSLSFNL